jgi:hypothetical protein
MRLKSRVAAVCVAAACVACRDAGPVSPTPPQAMTYYGCETDPTCSGGGGGGGGGFATDPNPSAVGYWMGTTVTPSTCISPSGAGISDADYDGLSDYCESLLAAKFRPALTLSAYDCNPGMEPYWAAKVFPNEGNVVRVAYLFSYYEDCGAPDTYSIGCTLLHAVGNLGTLAGLLPTYSVGPLVVSSEDLCAGHQGDSEFVLEDLAFDGASQHWYVRRTFFSAHWRTDGDHSRWTATSGLEYPDKYGGYPRVWVAEGKHANYPTRYACSNQGGAADTCQSNPNGGTQIRQGQLYNVGSAQQPFINAQTCVTGGALVQYYPDLYGIECYWKPADLFGGWSKYPEASDASPYYTILIAGFECYGYTLTSLFQMTCSDWGVNRKALM